VSTVMKLVLFIKDRAEILHQLDHYQFLNMCAPLVVYSHPASSFETEGPEFNCLQASGFQGFISWVRQKARGSFSKLRKVCLSTSIRRDTKIRIFNACCVKSVLFYGCEFGLLQVKSVLLYGCEFGLLQVKYVLLYGCEFDLL
jgi:hypothetical protein